MKQLRHRTFAFGVLSALALITLAAISVRPAFSGLAQFTNPAGGGTASPDHWDFSAFSVSWQLNPATGGNISGNRAVADVVQASFNTWLAAPNTVLQVSRGGDLGDTSAGFNPSSTSNTNLVCFVCSGDFSKDSSTLAVTITTTEDRPNTADGHGGRSRFVGQLLDADILFNPGVQFSTGNGAGQDLQTVATHEIGHFFGLDHSAVVRAMMFPFAPDFEVTLGYDDVSAISQLYPKSSPDFPNGAINGRVTLGGAAVFGAHVFAQSVTNDIPVGGSIRKTPIGTLTLPDGTYRIPGVPPDQYIVVAEPLDEPERNMDVSGYPHAFGQSGVQTNFTTRWH
jgi:hypothetical protein